jgi:hypothetical protein
MCRCNSSLRENRRPQSAVEQTNVLPLELLESDATAATTVVGFRSVDVSRAIDDDDDDVRRRFAGRTSSPSFFDRPACGDCLSASPTAFEDTDCRLEPAAAAQPSGWNSPIVVHVETSSGMG